MISLLFSRTHSLGSMLIRLGTWSSWSHVDMVSSNDVVVGATYECGVCATPIERRLREASRFALYQIVASKEQEDAFRKYVWSQMGKPYDASAVLGMTLRRNWHEDDSWFCSEMLAHAGEVSGIRLIGKQSWRVTPQDLWESVRGVQMPVGKVVFE